jgi:hypothetical protein
MGMLALFANAGLVTGIFVVLAIPALLRRASWGWLLLAVVVVLADFLATAGGGDLQKFVPYLAHAHWG